jgi:hypothetical protein
MSGRRSCHFSGLDQSSLDKTEHTYITLGDLAVLVAGVALVLVLPRSQSYWPYRTDFLGPWPRWLPWCFCLRQALGSACLALVPVILRRRASYGGRARPAEFLAICAAMPVLADAVETGLIRLKYRQWAGHSLPGFTLDGIPIAVVSDWRAGGHWIWERSLLVAGALALAGFFLGRRRLPGWLQTVFLSIAWLAAYEAGTHRAFDWIGSAITVLIAQPMSETTSVLLSAGTYLFPRFVLYSVPAVAALLDLRQRASGRPNWLEWTGAGLGAALFVIAEPTELLREYAVTSSKGFWVFETLVRVSTMLAALTLAVFAISRQHHAHRGHAKVGGRDA